MREVAVEQAGSETWERFRALRLAALEDAPDAFCATLQEERSKPESYWKAWLGETTGLLATVRTGGDVARDAGLAVVGRSFEDPEVAGLYAVWVAPWARGWGVGNALVGTAVTRARTLGYGRLVLDVGDRNTPAIRLYERFGFQPTGRTSRFPAPQDHVTEHERAVDLRSRGAVL